MWDNIGGLVVVIPAHVCSFDAGSLGKCQSHIWL